MGLYKGMGQNIITGSYMLPNADDKEKREGTRQNNERRSYL
jgi:hypothetical protein